MGTISDKLERVLKTKKDIQNALVKNGKYVPDKLPFKYYPYLIDNMNIDGLVGMYYGKGLTNEELSKDPTWYDTSGNGNDLKFKNLAFKLDSGAGKYFWDFNSWIGSIESKPIDKTSSKIRFLGSNGNQYCGVVINKEVDKQVIVKTSVKVTGLTSDLPPLYFGKFNLGESNLLQLKEGINIIDKTIDSSLSWYGFGFREGVPSCDITIEQIPDYQGAICFNGIDDCAICDNFPILTKEKGYTVMVLRKWINKKNAYDGLISNKNAWSDGCAFLVEYNDGIKDGTISFNRNTYVNYSQNFLVYQTSEYYNGNQILTGDAIEGTNILNVGRLASSGFSQYSNFAIYALCIIDHDTSDAEREIVINKWRKYFPELL